MLASNISTFSSVCCSCIVCVSRLILKARRGTVAFCKGLVGKMKGVKRLEGLCRKEGKMSNGQPRISVGTGSL